MKHLVKIVFFTAWLFSLGLTAYMFYITLDGASSAAHKWAYAVMYSITVIASSLITYNVLFPQSHIEDE
ncbi:MAG: hypothetical protein GX447_00120 [Elusimicrobia bacterium]|nr:hypothetical protein [Elusimicrobiota bacterium]